MPVGAARAVQISRRAAGGGGSTPSFTRQIAASADDAEERTPGSGSTVTLTSSDIDLGHDTSDGVPLIVFLRFTNITLNAADTVNTAHIQFTADAVHSDAITYSIVGVAEDNAATATTTAANISGRAKTTASVSWSPAAWAAVDDQLAAQLTPNLKTIVDEIKARGGWASGNAMAFIIERTAGIATSAREARAFDNIPASAAILDIN